MTVIMSQFTVGNTWNKGVIRTTIISKIDYLLQPNFDFSEKVYLEYRWLFLFIVSPNEMEFTVCIEGRSIILEQQDRINFCKYVLISHTWSFYVISNYRKFEMRKRNKFKLFEYFTCTETSYSLLLLLNSVAFVCSGMKMKIEKKKMKFSYDALVHSCTIFPGSPRKYCLLKLFYYLSF